MLNTKQEVFSRALYKKKKEQQTTIKLNLSIVGKDVPRLFFEKLLESELIVHLLEKMEACPTNDGQPRNSFFLPYDV